MKCRSASTPRIGRGRPLLSTVALLAALWAQGVAAETAAADPETAAKTAKAAAPKKPRPKFQGPAECVRTGQRVIAALARDDSGAATQFYTFYSAFKCPPKHLAEAFGCLVELQTQNSSISNPSPEQVSQCWNDPATVPVVKPEPPPKAPAQGQ